jgi:hypothetical protein
MEHFDMHTVNQEDNGHRVLCVLVTSLALAVAGMVFVALTGQSF